MKIVTIFPVNGGGIQLCCSVLTPIQGAAVCPHWLPLARLGVEVSSNRLGTSKSSHLGSQGLSLSVWVMIVGSCMCYHLLKYSTTVSLWILWEPHSFKHIYAFNMYIFVPGHMPTMCMQCLGMPEKGIGSPKAGVPGRWESSVCVLETEHQSLPEQQAL